MDERVQPTDEMRCTETCPSFNSKTCRVCGEFKVAAEVDASGCGGDRCTPACDAIQDAYQASRKKVPRQEYNVIGAGFTGSLISDVNDAIDQGWRVSGGVSVVKFEPTAGPAYLQAMVRDVPTGPQTDEE